MWVVLWTLCVFIGTGGGILWKRLAFALACLIPATFTLFANAFPSDQHLSRRNPIVLTSVSFGVVFSLLSLTPLVVSGSSYNRHVHTLTYGPAYPAVALYFIASFATSFLVLWYKYRLLRGIERLRMRYLIVGTLLAVLGGVTTNLIVPLLFRTSALRLLGPAFTVFAFAFVAHAILRYRLMDITLVLRKGTTYALSLLVSSAVLFFGASLCIYAILGHTIASEVFLLTLIIGSAVAFVFSSLLRLFQAVFDRYIRRPTYNAHAALQDITITLSSFLDQGALLNYVCHVLRQTVQPAFVALYTENRQTFDQILLAAQTHHAEAAVPVSFANSERFILELGSSCEPLIREELPPQKSEIASQMNAADWDVVFPIKNRHRLLGFMAFGAKLSQDPYFTSDIKFLTAITSQIGVVLTNISLYKEVKNVKEHLEGILRNMESGVIVIDNIGRVDTVNAVAQSLLGAAIPDIYSRHVDVLPVELSAPLLLAVHHGQTTFQAEVSIYDHSRGRINLVLSTSLLRDSQLEILGAILVFSDRTRIKQLELEQRRVERLAAFERLAAGIAHEIKNPLVAIKTFAELLPERFTDEEFRDSFSQVAIREIDRIATLVDRLKGIAAPAALRLPPIDIKVPLHDIMTLLRGKLEHANIKVNLEADADLPLISGDVPQIKQLLLNVLMNGIEAMEGGGELSIRLVSSNVHNRDRRLVTVIIEDTGCGIPETVLGEIFSPFVTTKPRGSGLGLSICRGIVDSHNATIKVSNNINSPGVKVVLEFPTANETQPILTVR
jgi:signal transduction histidine kinase